MDLATRLYLLLLAAVGAGRLVELALSRSHQRLMLARGAVLLPEASFPFMVLTHAGVLLGSALEVVFLHRPIVRPVAAIAGLSFLLATALRWWVIGTLAGHWNVRVMDSTRLGVVSIGPYRWLRHPNYLAVMVELAALPLIHSAWITALTGSLANSLVVYRRIVTEERVLMRSAEYRASMASKPRLLPRIGRL
jgi:methyltransferase